MSRQTPILIVVVVVVIAFGLIYLATSHKQTAPDQAIKAPLKKEELPQSPAVGVQGAEIEQRDPSGKLQWKVQAGGDLQFDKGRQVAVGKNVKFQVVQGDRVPVTVSAPTFEANYTSRKLTFTDGVVGQVTDGSSRFGASRLEYDLDTKKLQGAGGVRFMQGQYTATAQEIVVDPAQKKVRLRGDVRFARSS